MAGVQIHRLSPSTRRWIWIPCVHLTLSLNFFLLLRTSTAALAWAAGCLPYFGPVSRPTILIDSLLSSSTAADVMDSALWLVPVQNYFWNYKWIRHFVHPPNGGSDQRKVSSYTGQCNTQNVGDKQPCLEPDSNPRSQYPNGQDPRLRSHGQSDLFIFMWYKIETLSPVALFSMVYDFLSYRGARLPNSGNTASNSFVFFLECHNSEQCSLLLQYFSLIYFKFSVKSHIKSVLQLSV
jgi:hypothetical protein